jgi:hypothetical protein
LEDGKLVLDAGELHSELRPIMDEAGKVTFYVFTDPPLSSTPVPVMLQGSDGTPEIVIAVDSDDGATYTLTQVAGSAAATPEP